MHRTPDQLRSIDDSQASPDRDIKAAEFARGLIQTDLKRHAEDQMEDLLLTGINTAESELMPTDWHVIRSDALGRVKGRKNSV